MKKLLFFVDFAPGSLYSRSSCCRNGHTAVFGGRKKGTPVAGVPFTNPAFLKAFVVLVDCLGNRESWGHNQNQPVRATTGNLNANMATNKPAGDGHRIGAVRQRSQFTNPVTKLSQKRDANTGRIMDVKTTGGDFKGVRREKKSGS